MNGPAALEEDWPAVLTLMPADFEESAFTKLALVRRREIGSAGDLLRLVFAYALCDMSLREVAAWADVQRLGHLCAVAVRQRLQHAHQWLGHLIVGFMQERGLAAAVPGVRVRIVDATVICEPGSKGSDWRIHLGLDLAQLSIASVELTDGSGGESFRRFDLAPDEILLGDRGYGSRAGLASVLDQGGHLVVRINWQNCPLETLDGHRVDLLRVLEPLQVGEIGDWPVQIRVANRVHQLRLVATRKTPAAAQKEQRTLRKAATKKKHAPDPRSLQAACFTYVLTDLPVSTLVGPQVLELYRLRWQVEMAFKRCKGILHFDHLRAKDEDLARTYLLAKILGALLVEELGRSAPSFFPWGYPLFLAPPQSVALAEPVDGLPM